MITRSANRKAESPLGNHQAIQQQTRSNTDIVTNANEQPIIHTELQNPFQTPVLNIHIHMPPHTEGNLKNYLPKIQPVIHFHFNELERKLELNSPQSFKEFRNVLEASPKFGDVTFHYSNKSMENSDTGSEVDREIPCSSKNNLSDDSKSCSLRENNEKSLSENKEISDCYECNSSGSVKTTPKSDLKDPLMSELYKKFKLKDAVLMLRDVCKTNYYKNKVAVSNHRIHRKNKNNEKKKSCGTVDQVVNESKEGNGVVAPEELSKDPKPQQESSCSESRGGEIANDASISTSSDISLTQPQKIASHNSSNTVAEACPIKTLSALAEGCDFSEILNRFRYSQSKGFFTDDKKDFYSINSNQNCFTEAVTESLEESKNAYINRNPAEQTPTQQNFYQVNMIKTGSKDDRGGASEKQLISQAVMWDSEEMGRKRPNKTHGVNQLEKKVGQTQSTSSPSKKKRRNEMHKKSSNKSQKSTKVEEYIPLQVSGPTQFVVAPLNKVNPYKTHDARNFKTEMLFGKNRVKRFPSSDHLRIYKMKKRALRNRSAFYRG